MSVCIQFLSSMVLWSISIRRRDAKCHVERGGGGGEWGRGYKVLRSRVETGGIKTESSILVPQAEAVWASKMWFAEFWLFLLVYCCYLFCQTVFRGSSMLLQSWLNKGPSVFPLCINGKQRWGYLKWLPWFQWMIAIMKMGIQYKRRHLLLEKCFMYQ